MSITINQESEYLMFMKLFGTLAIALGFVVAAMAAAAPTTVESNTLKGCCSAEGCCEGCPDCGCDKDCCDNCEDGCDCTCNS